MAGLDASVIGNLKQQPQMSLGDMMNLATNAQAYKQAQQVNPETLRTATAQAQGAEQTAESGGIDLQVKQQGNDERLALQNFFKDPENYQTDGQMDLSKINAAVPKIAPLTGPKYIETLTSLNKSQTDANSASQDFSQKTRGIVGGTLGTLGYAGINDPKIYVAELNRLKNGAPNEKALGKYVDSQIDYINNLPEGSNLSQAAIAHSQELLSPEQQYSKFAPQAKPVDVGGVIKEEVSAPSVAGSVPGVKIGKVLSRKTLTPQVVPGITGGFTIIGGGGAGNSAGTGTVGTGTSGVPNQNAISPAPGQTAESTKANINTGINDYREAVAAQSDPNNPKGHIPTKLFNNKNILTLLKDPEVDTAHIANYFSDPLKYKFLTPKEQDLAKYLEQRVQGLNPSSVMDLQSKHQAYGTTALKKEALMELMRNESGSLATEDLLTRGRKNAGGNPNQPNASAVNNFNNAFSNYASDPLLMKYIGIVGEGKTARLDKQDQDDIGRLYARLPKDKNGKTTGAANALELKRQALLRLVDGSK